MLLLRVETPDGEAFQHRSDSSELTVGRSSDANLSLADRFLSRIHARFVERDGAWWIEDMGSRNGTFLNEDRVKEAAIVKTGDAIRLSGCILRVQPDEVHSDPSTDWGDGGATIFRAASDILQGTKEESVGDSPEALREYAERLKLLNDVHHALSRPISLTQLLELILDRAFKHVGPEEGAVFLRRPDGSYERAAEKTNDTEGEDYLYSETLLREVGDKGLAALVLDAGSDERFKEAKSIMTSGVRSLVAAPLMDPEGSLGIIVLNSRLHRRQFDEADMSLLTSLASVAALRIRNVALAEEAAERQRLEEELELARRIQVALLPDALPDIEGYEVLATNIPSRGVSGDFYEIVPREKDCFLLIADVSGKGIAASLLTASFEALAAGPIEDGADPEVVTTRVSSRLFRRTPSAKYATAWLGVLAPETGKVRYTNAGHNPALHVHSDGEVDQLGPTGMPVGLVEGAEYSANDIVLQPGDALLLYTDGITESEDPSGEEFGTDRLADFCREHRKDEIRKFSKALEAHLDQFTNDQPAADDRTVVILRRLST